MAEEAASGQGPSVEELDSIITQVGRLSPGSIARQIALQIIRGERSGSMGAGKSQSGTRSEPQ